MDINTMDIEKFVKFINAELKKDKTISVNKLCDKLSIKKSTLKSRMTRGKYSYNIELRQYIKDNTTSNIESVAVAKDDNTSNITEVPKEDNTNNILLLNDFDAEKLNLLLNNLDGLLKLVEVKDNTSNITIDSNKTRVTSLRINEEIYDLIKDRAVKINTSISDIVNRALLDYLNNYL